MLSKKIKVLKRLIKKNKYILSAGLIVIIPLIFYKTYYTTIIVSQETWGQFGDFFGGTVNPLLTFLTICILINSIYLQQKQLRISLRELKLTKGELAENRQEMKNSNAIAERNILELESKHKREDFLTITKIISESIIKTLDSNFYSSSLFGYAIKNEMKIIMANSSSGSRNDAFKLKVLFFCKQLGEFNRILVEFNSFENSKSLVPNHYYLQFQEYAEILKGFADYKDKFHWAPIDNKSKS